MTVAFREQYFKLYLGTTIYFAVNILYYFFPNSWHLIVLFKETCSAEWEKQTPVSSKKRLVI